MSTHKQVGAAQTQGSSSGSMPGGLLQRKCACGGASGLTSECEACDRKPILQRQRNAQSEASAVPTVVDDVLGSPGEPLEGATRSFMESRFGHDFGRVRVHTDARAAESARSVKALAYTVGQNVVFDTGQYAPNTRSGRHTLAHELAHVVQQRHAHKPSPLSKLSIGSEHDSLEREADNVAASVMAAQPLAQTGSSLPTPTLQRLSFVDKALRFFGAESGEFTDDELMEYLERIAKNRQCDCGLFDFLSDDKARAIADRGGVGQHKLDQDFKGVPSVEIRRILIQEMLDGPTTGPDELAIIKILKDSKPADVLAIIDPARGLSVKDLEADIDGDNQKELFRVLAEKLPDVGKPQVGRSETPDPKSGACTVSRAIKIHFAHSQAEALVKNAIDLLDKFLSKPAENKLVGERVNCYFKGANKDHINQIRENFKLISSALPSLNYVCPGEPFEQFKVTSPQGTRVFEKEPDLMARALVEEGEAKKPAEDSKPKAGETKAEQTKPLRILLFPEFFDLTPLEQVRVVIHESFHHAKKQGEGVPEFYQPSCGKVELKEALENADSYAKIATSLEHEGLQFSFTDCPQAWKDEMIAAAETAQLWVNVATAKLDALVANPKQVDGRASGQLKRHFKIEPTSVDDLKKVRDVFAEIQSAFGGALPFECETKCSYEDVTGYVGGFLGITPRGGNIHFCPHWFENLDHKERAETIVHEMAHRFAGRGEQLYYKKDFNRYFKLSFKDSLDNADSFAQFARYVQE